MPILTRNMPLDLWNIDRHMLQPSPSPSKSRDFTNINIEAQKSARK